MGQHKYARAGLVARTTSSAVDVVAMVKACASSQEPDVFRGLGTVTVVSVGADEVELATMGGLGYKFKQLAFTVAISPVGPDTGVRTTITWYRTSQSTVAGFIPVGPKTMVGYKTYNLFLTRLAKTLQDADSGAVLEISVTADQTAAPTSAS